MRRITSLLAWCCAAMTSAGAHAAVEPVPEPFASGAVEFALVNFISSGDYFQAYERGAQAQAQTLGVRLRVFPGRADPAAQAQAVEQASALGVAGIIVNLGVSEALLEPVRQARAAGIAVVAYDVELQLPGISTIEQGDAQLADLVLQQALRTHGTRFAAGYVHVPGFAPLDRRDAVWEALRERHPGIVETARWGSLDEPVATVIATQTAAVLRAHPDIQVIFAPYNEFARGVKLAVVEAGLDQQVQIYSADISSADIQEMREADSPWVATAATNPDVLGRLAVRALALRVAGRDPGSRLLVPPVLITRQQLLEADIHNVEQLAQQVPAFAASELAPIPWLAPTP